VPPSRPERLRFVRSNRCLLRSLVILQTPRHAKPTGRHPPSHPNHQSPTTRPLALPPPMNVRVCYVGVDATPVASGQTNGAHVVASNPPFNPTFGLCTSRHATRHPRGQASPSFIYFLHPSIHSLIHSSISLASYFSLAFPVQPPGLYPHPLHHHHKTSQDASSFSLNTSTARGRHALASEMGCWRNDPSPLINTPTRATIT
jgi:hypothetical protein